MNYDKQCEIAKGKAAQIYFAICSIVFFLMLLNAEEQYKLSILAGLIATLSLITYIVGFENGLKYESPKYYCFGFNCKKEVPDGKAYCKECEP